MQHQAFIGELIENPKIAKLLQGWIGEEVVHLPEMPRSAQALVAALILRQFPDRTICFLASTIKEAERFSWDLEVFESEFTVFREVMSRVVDSESQDEEQSEDTGLWQDLDSLLSHPKKVILTTEAGYAQQLPDPEAVKQSRSRFAVGDEFTPESLTELLGGSGYDAEALVVERGQYSRRAGIMDVFPYGAELPIRIEWFGNAIDSMREFDPAEQTSLREIDSFHLPLTKELNEESLSCSLEDYLPEHPLKVYLGIGEDQKIDSATLAHEHSFLGSGGFDQILLENRRALVLKEIESWFQEGLRVILVCHNEGEEQRLREWLQGEEDFKLLDRLEWRLFPWSQGFYWKDAGLVILTDAEIFGRYQSLRRSRNSDRMEHWRRASRRQEFTDFEEGDHVVHLEYGIGQYVGLKELPDSKGGKSKSVLEIEFSESSRLFVPIEQGYLISRYVSGNKKPPILDTLGNKRWARRKEQAGDAIYDYAARLLQVQAARNTEAGFAFPEDTAWQYKFEDAFPYKETADQLKAISETKIDMESSLPTDRLICGDVGFGKTEVAIRAAFKAVMSSKQVAFLVPTTVLAQQHFQTFTERMADYPVKIAMVSRFISAAEQRKTLKRVLSGEIDILIGTHRLLSKDVVFKDLGLVIVDEEQRFGVEHKEALKEKYRLIDMITLSATPIPRTLYMALMGTRDMSTIETPPRNRLPVDTTIHVYDERLIRTAIQRELARGGQVYFLHNRVKTIDRMAKQIEFLIPDARVGVGHGQMNEHELEDIMHKFMSGELDVLVSTTIIESGIDIPNANTIIIDRADRFGLADLYQLRGRVGRSDTRAYALLMLPRDLIQGDAGKRVRTIRQYSHLGAGFKVAMRDLEIRGAGNLLGTAQSGHIASVGFELYCRLLKQAVSELRGEKTGQVKDIQLKLDFLYLGQQGEVDQASAYVPVEYISESSLRIQAYRDLAELQEVTDLEALRTRWKDRFGRWPEAVELLFLYNRLRITALAGNITQIEVKGTKLMMLRNGDYIMVNGKFPRLLKTKAKSRLKEIETWINAFQPS
ncbi:MAG: transcription-repair coupling factor [Verrucomicrobiota bacterium]